MLQNTLFLQGRSHQIQLWCLLHLLQHLEPNSRMSVETKEKNRNRGGESTKMKSKEKELRVYLDSHIHLGKLNKCLHGVKEPMVIRRPSSNLAPVKWNTVHEILVEGPGQLKLRVKIQIPRQNRNNVSNKVEKQWVQSVEITDLHGQYL